MLGVDPADELIDRLQVLCLADLVMVFLDVDQFFLAAVLLVEQLGVGVVDEAVTLGGHEYSRNFDVLHLLY